MKKWMKSVCSMLLVGILVFSSTSIAFASITYIKFQNLVRVTEDYVLVAVNNKGNLCIYSADETGTKESKSKEVIVNSSTIKNIDLLVTPKDTNSIVIFLDDSTKNYTGTINSIIPVGGLTLEIRGNGRLNVHQTRLTSPNIDTTSAIAAEKIKVGTGTDSPSLYITNDSEDLDYANGVLARQQFVFNSGYIKTVAKEAGVRVESDGSNALVSSYEPSGIYKNATLEAEGGIYGIRMQIPDFTIEGKISAHSNGTDKTKLRSGFTFEGNNLTVTGSNAQVKAWAGDEQSEDTITPSTNTNILGIDDIFVYQKSQKISTGFAVYSDYNKTVPNFTVSDGATINASGSDYGLVTRTSLNISGASTVNAIGSVHGLDARTKSSPSISATDGAHVNGTAIGYNDTNTTKLKRGAGIYTNENVEATKANTTISGTNLVTGSLGYDYINTNIKDTPINTENAIDVATDKQIKAQDNAAIEENYPKVTFTLKPENRFTPKNNFSPIDSRLDNDIDEYTWDFKLKDDSAYKTIGSTSFNDFSDYNGQKYISPLTNKFFETYNNEDHYMKLGKFADADIYMSTETSQGDTLKLSTNASYSVHVNAKIQHQLGITLIYKYFDENSGFLPDNANNYQLIIVGENWEFSQGSYGWPKIVSGMWLVKRANPDSLTAKTTTDILESNDYKLDIKYVITVYGTRLTNKKV